MGLDLEIIINFKDGTQAITDNWIKAENYYKAVLSNITTIFINDELVYNWSTELDSFLSFTPIAFVKKEIAYKETEGKLNYEIDFDFLTQVAERMSSNKGKYKPYNWKNLDNVEELKQSLFRHTLEVMKGNYSDDGRDYGHIEGAVCNLMFINYQLNNKNEGNQNSSK